MSWYYHLIHHCDIVPPWCVLLGFITLSQCVIYTQRAIHAATKIIMH